MPKTIEFCDTDSRHVDLLIISNKYNYAKIIIKIIKYYNIRMKYIP